MRPAAVYRRSSPYQFSLHQFLEESRLSHVELNQPCRRTGTDPAAIPLDRRRTQEHGPEPSQLPRIGTVQHDFAYPADRTVVAIAHQPMMNDTAAHQT